MVAGKGEHLFSRTGPTVKHGFNHTGVLTDQRSSGVPLGRRPLKHSLKPQGQLRHPISVTNPQQSVELVSGKSSRFRHFA